MNRTSILVPDTEWGRGADWAGLPVDLRYYDLDDPDPAGDNRSAILIDLKGPASASGRLIGRLPALRVLQTLTAGVEHWDGHLPDGVMLVNCSGAHGGATAEIAIAGLLALYRRLPEIFVNNAARNWTLLPGETVNGQTAVVIGAGDVGHCLATRLQALGARVDVAARTARDGVIALADAVAGLAAYDIVALATPLTEATRGLVDAAFLARMKDRAVLVNIGRGPIVATDALVGEVQPGRLRAVLDVTDPEPLPPGHPLWSVPGVIITPHVGGAVHSAFANAMRVAIGQIAAVMAGETPSNHIRGPKTMLEPKV